MFSFCWLYCISHILTPRADIITESQSKGLGNFVSKFALPALLFKNMVLLDFGHVIWAFLWSVLVAKVCVLFIFLSLCQSTVIANLGKFKQAKWNLNETRLVVCRWPCLSWYVCWHWWWPVQRADTVRLVCMPSLLRRAMTSPWDTP